MLNSESRGYSVAVFNSTKSRMDGLLESTAKGKNIAGADTPEALCAMLERPRKIMFMVAVAIFA